MVHISIYTVSFIQPHLIKHQQLSQAALLVLLKMTLSALPHNPSLRPLLHPLPACYSGA